MKKQVKPAEVGVSRVEVDHPTCVGRGAREVNDSVSGVEVEPPHLRGARCTGSE